MWWSFIVLTKYSALEVFQGLTKMVSFISERSWIQQTQRVVSGWVLASIRSQIMWAPPENWQFHIPRECLSSQCLWQRIFFFVFFAFSWLQKLASGGPDPPHAHLDREETATGLTAHMRRLTQHSLQRDGEPGCRAISIHALFHPPPVLFSLVLVGYEPQQRAVIEVHVSPHTSLLFVQISRWISSIIILSFN